jgi:NADH:ubiquinone oxidoreductase subunit K
MGLISLLWGIVAMVLMFVGLVPLLGWSNWLVIPFAGVGAIIAAIGIMLTSSEKRGRAKAGLILNAIVIVVAAVRLSMGGGII